MKTNPTVAVGIDDVERLRRPAGPRSLQLGDTRVTYVPDGDIQLPPTGWLPATTDAHWAAHPEYLDAAGQLVAGMGGLLVERDGRALLIDAGLGPLTLPPNPEVPHGTMTGGALLDSLAALGRSPEDIEALAFTHPHPDHTGWALHPAPESGRLPFAHATHLLSEADLPGLEAHPDETHGPAQRERDIRILTDGQEIFPGVRARITGGHTPGHTEYVITGGGRRLIAFGDSMHSPVQATHPEWSAAGDEDPAASAAHRHRLVAELAEPDTIGFGIHFADVPFGRVEADGAGDTVWRAVDA